MDYDAYTRIKPAAPQTIIHMDLDAFFVSVERLLNSNLKGIPLIVGGNGGRGVVASCSYEARKFGVHSAMPTSKALRLCPEAQVVSGDMESYSKFSKMVTEIIKEESPMFEKASVDEFYIDASGMDRFYDTLAWAKELRKRIIGETGLPISMGISINKMVSKVVTSEYKPNAEKYLTKKEVRNFLDPLAVKKIPMIGRKTAQLLAEMGVTHIKTLRKMPIKVLENTFGKNGRILWRRANGIDYSTIAPYSAQKSISTECTFGCDTIDFSKIRVILIAMVEKLAFKLREQRKLTSCIAVKIRYSNFHTETKQLAIAYTASDRTLINLALNLFKKLYEKGRQIRLVGIRFSALVYGNYQISLFEDTEESIQLYRALDTIRGRFGQSSIVRAATSDVSNRIRLNNNLFDGRQ